MGKENRKKAKRNKSLEFKQSFSEVSFVQMSLCTASVSQLNFFFFFKRYQQFHFNPIERGTELIILLFQTTLNYPTLNNGLHFFLHKTTFFSNLSITFMSTTI